MKTIDISKGSADVNALLEQARREDLIVRAPDGTEFMVSAVDDFDHEIACTRRNARLMALLDQRAKQDEVVSLHEVKRQFGLGE